MLRDASKRAPGESIFSVINARSLASINLHLELGFVEAWRSARYAGIEFTGGEGVLLRHARPRVSEVDMCGDAVEFRFNV
ncbi:hypothetical protein EV641_104192 [Rhodococcus sp. SMB37]|nr:hypothetical protein EV641_104192 [Rhodococcus sp. SMB37]